MIIYGIDIGLSIAMLAIWAVGFVMGLLTSSLVRDILREKFTRR